jgi:5-methylcytosine-specific restriction endonuclease McrA
MTPIPKPTPRRKEPKPLKSKPHAIPASVKQQVFDRDNWTCRWCSMPGGALDAHHVIRRSQGGPDSVPNLVSVHRICHRAIHDNVAEAKLRGFLA